jgi:hypothetical protein
MFIVLRHIIGVGRVTGYGLYGQGSSPGCTMLFSSPQLPTESDTPAETSDGHEAKNSPQF